MTIAAITNAPMTYPWGQPGGVARVLGWEPTAPVQAEYWLGAHAVRPSRVIGGPWADLGVWQEETGETLPYLMKVLTAANPLSLQAHPTAQQARAGFAREEGAGVPLLHPARTYKDPHAKPELVVALEDGFEALCGFRPIPETAAFIDEVAAVAPHPTLDRWRALMTGTGGVRETFRWLLSGAPEVDDLMATLDRAAAREPGRLGLVTLLRAQYPGDPGVAAAQMLNHQTLRAGDSLWLPAGNIHAYLSGTALELMGPSDNVLRGGLTTKHVDKGELARVLDFRCGEPPHLVPVSLDANVVSYRPRSLASGIGVWFELVSVTGDAAIRTASASIALCLAGDFELATSGSRHHLARGDAAFVSTAGEVAVRGGGVLYVATSGASTSEAVPE